MNVKNRFDGCAASQGKEAQAKQNKQNQIKHLLAAGY